MKKLPELGGGWVSSPLSNVHTHGCKVQHEIKCLPPKDDMLSQCVNNELGLQRPACFPLHEAASTLTSSNACKGEKPIASKPSDDPSPSICHEC